MPLSYFPCPRLFRNGELSQSLQDPYLDEEEGVSRISMLLGVVTFVVVAMGAYNLAWRQPQLASLREIAQAKSAIIEIDATGKASKAIVPSTRAEITVEGSDLCRRFDSKSGGVNVDTIEVTVTLSIPVQDKWQFVAGDALREVIDTIYMHPNAMHAVCNDQGERYKAYFEVKGN